MSLLNDASLVMVPSGYKDTKLYSVKPTDGSGDFTFSRGSNLAATRVNSDGLIEKGRENLLLQSNQFDTTWLIIRSSVSSGSTDPFGGSNAWSFLTDTTANDQHYIYQGISQSGVGTLSIYAKANGYNWLRLRLPSEEAYFDVANGVTGSSTTGISASITDVSNGWYRCEVAISDMSTNPNVFIHITENDGDIIINGTPSGNDGLYIYSAQLESGLVATNVIETGASTAQAGILEDMPRLDYSGGATCPSLLLEPQRTNLLTHSEYFGGYSVNNGTATANEIISPEGILNGYKFTENTGTSAHYIDTTSISVTSGNDYVISVFGKYDGRFLTIQGSSSIISSNYATFNLETGVVEQENIGNASIEDYGNGWYRCIFKITATGTGSGAITILLNDSATGGRSRSYTGDGTSGIYLYGFQVEAGSYPTSYIPTYGGSSVTRSVDSCVKTGISSLIGQSEGTLFYEGRALSDAYPNDSWMSVSNGAASNRVMIGYYRTQNFIRLFATFQGTNVLDETVNVGDFSEVKKIAIAYALNDIVVYVNGTNVITDTNTSSKVPINMDRFGFENENGTYPLYAKVNQAILFPTRLSNDELAQLTTI